MKFSHIRLAGFKSFADPVNIPVTGALTGVVGPNGCGKSNVIDAVRWVMGERSASALRGEGMDDVIFNGTTSRPPADRCSVELFFRQVQLPGDSPWSAFHELSIKRLIHRNHTSDYFINQQKVRRKDVADLFLGTGLGPRSYAIIEQGMVGKIIEANPKELRVFLEEAAGVSKYKERRHETENRMEDARSNLHRVDDIRVEVAAQVERLHGQALIARQYQTLQQAFLADQRLVALIQWSQELGLRQRAMDDFQAHQHTVLEIQTHIQTLEQEQIDKEQQWQEAQDQLEIAQSNVMAYNAQIAELEQDLRLGNQRRQHLEDNLQKLMTRLESLREQAARLEEESGNHTEHHDSFVVERQQAEHLYQEQLQAFYEAERSLAAHRQHTESRKDVLARLMSQAAAEAKSIAMTQERLLALEVRLGSIQESLLPLTTEITEQTDLAETLSPYAEPLAEAIEQEVQRREMVEEIREEIAVAEADWQDNQRILAECRQRESGLSARIETLERQVLATQAHDSALQSWLEKHDILTSQPLEEVIHIDDAWEHAVAVVLADALGIRCVSDWTRLADLPLRATIPPMGNMVLHAEETTPTPLPGSLAEKVRLEDPNFSAWVVSRLNVYRVCDDWQIALSQRSQLSDGCYWVSKNGVVVGRHHLRFPGDGGARAIHLENRHALDNARAEQQSLAETIQLALVAEAQANKKRERLLDQQRQWEKDSAAQRLIRERLSEQEREWQFQQQSAAEKVAWQRREWEKQRDELMAEREELQNKIAQDAPQSGAHADLQTKQTQALEEDQRALMAQELAVRDKREALRQQELLVHKLQHQAEQAKRDLSRLDEQRQTCHRLMEEAKEQGEGIQEELANMPIAEALDLSLQQLLEQKTQQQALMADLRHRADALFQHQKQGSAARQKWERQIEQTREKITQTQLAIQASDLRSQQYREDFVRYGGDIASLANVENPLDALAGNKDRTIAELKRTITEHESQMKALEPVNLAAIAELENESARLAELDKQREDLHAALATLQEAIGRIDQEMRSRMSEVFTRVNLKFGELFRTIFGGGNAEILLTGEEILDAGVMLKAQPLGKNNASIHLLSGGEKALTAIALVFAFFSLNPAPFCVLDEVDAPLDDANTRRFTELIRDMSASTQFLVISHNRITMEAMETLVGVTMRDPGVSKVVSVDLLNALASAEKIVATANDAAPL